MWRLLATLLFSSLGCLVDSSCARINNSSDMSHLNFSDCFTPTEVDFRLWKSVKELDLSNNNITSLSGLESAAKLELLFLRNNKLKTLPSNFFAQTPKLKVLHLEKNQLEFLPTKDIRQCLTELHVDCRCDVASSILDYCRNCSDQGNKCQCSTSERVDNVTDYYEKGCRDTKHGLYVGIIVPVLILLLLAVLVFFLVWRKKKVPINQEKRSSNTSEGTSGQSRYISRLSPPGNGFQGMHKDYENVINDQSKGKVGKMKTGQGHHQNQKQTSTKRSPSKGENRSENRDPSEGHQPIYANTQELYYNYSGKPIPEAVEDVYIIPDQ